MAGSPTHKNETHTPWRGRQSPVLGAVLAAWYGVAPRSLRDIIRSMVCRLEGGPLYSRTIRAIFLRHHGVDVGLYSAVGCFVPNHFRAGTTIGRYCSIYDTARAFSANHPMNLRSSHALFCNASLGFVGRDLVQRTALEVGSDVFIGHNAILLPSVTCVGHGAVVGAGAVVSRDVPPYAVVVGNPARVVRFRFSPSVIDNLLAQQWWQHDVAELSGRVDSFTKPLDGSTRVR
jgi:virginiamycin A acetyltransferase